MKIFLDVFLIHLLSLSSYINFPLVRPSRKDMTSGKTQVRILSKFITSYMDSFQTVMVMYPNRAPKSEFPVS